MQCVLYNHYGLSNNLLACQLTIKKKKKTIERMPNLSDLHSTSWLAY